MDPLTYSIAHYISFYMRHRCRASHQLATRQKWRNTLVKAHMISRWRGGPVCTFVTKYSSFPIYPVIDGSPFSIFMSITIGSVIPNNNENVMK